MSLLSKGGGGCCVRCLPGVALYVRCVHLAGANVRERLDA